MSIAGGRTAGRQPKKLRPARTNATKQKLFEASMELIGERGAAGVTVDEIAAAAGVSKGTVYYNFGSKSDLIAQLLRHGVDILDGQAAERAGTLPRTPSPAMDDDDRPGHGLHGRVPVLRPAVGQRELADSQRMAGHLRRTPRRGCWQ